MNATGTFEKVYFSLFITGALLFGLWIGQGFLIPICLASMLTMLLTPYSNKLIKIGFGRGMADFTVILFLIILIYILGYLFYKQGNSIANDLPFLSSKAQLKLDTLHNWIEGNFGVKAAGQTEWLTHKFTEFEGTLTEWVSNLLVKATNLLVDTILILFYLFFFLQYREKFRVFILFISKPNTHRSIDKILVRIRKLIQSYLSGMFIEMIFVISLNSITLLILGVPYAIFLGIISGFLNIIPYLGILVAMLLAVSFALITSSGLFVPVLILICLSVIHLIDANFIVPNVVGSKVKLNPLFTIMAVLMGSLLWGIAGMILFIPLLGMLKAVFDNIDSLRPYGYLIGNDHVNETELERKITRMRRISKLREKRNSIL